MNRNVESHFSLSPSVDVKRSRFDRSHSVTTSFDVGDVVPFFIDEVLPGDTFSVDTSKVVRLSTPITPIMSNIYLDTYYFYVPSRLTWDNWKYFMGEAKSSPWLDETTYTPPTVSSPEGGWNVGTLADYLGIPVGVDGLEVQALPFRAYAKIIDDWFRDENLQTPVSIPTDDTDVTGTNGNNYITDLVKGGKPFIAAKYHDYFTSCLPSPQKGPSVQIGSVVGDTFPVVGNGLALGLTNGTELYGSITPAGSVSSTNCALYYNESAYGNEIGDISPFPSTWPSAPGVLGVPTLEQLAGNLEKTGLIGLTGATGVSINDLRLAFQMQRFYEKLALGGSRYIELIKSMFGVDSPDARLQRSEYLGGNRVGININQVVQTSATQAESGLTTTPQGTVAAYSVTSDTHSDFTKSFTEHGFVIGVVVARYDHSYQQGLSRMWTRKDRFDYYWPVFQSIGNQPVLNQEIFAQGSSAVNPVTNEPYDSEVFGYQEAWADYRYKQNQITGEMRSAASNSLDVWHLGDDYNSLPHLGSTWIKEDKTTVDRVLTVTSSNANQLQMDCYIKNIATRPMPLYSIPGMIDHF